MRFDRIRHDELEQTVEEAQCDVGIRVTVTENRALFLQAHYHSLTKDQRLLQPKYCVYLAECLSKACLSTTVCKYL